MKRWVLYSSILVTAFYRSTSGYAQVSDSSSAAETAESTERLKRDLERLKQRTEELKKTQEEKEELEAEREKVEFLADQAFALAEQGRYAEAKQILEEWKRADTQDVRILILEDLVTELERETNPEKRTELLMRFTAVLMGEMVEVLADMTQDLEKLNTALKDLGPQNADEELCIASSKGDVEKVWQLLSQGISANAKDRFGNTALDHAAGQGHAEVVKLLLSHGADVHAKGLLGATPLMTPARKGYASTVKVLIDAGIDVNAKSDTGVTALRLARKNGHSEIVELLTQAGAKE